MIAASVTIIVPRRVIWRWRDILWPPVNCGQANLSRVARSSDVLYINDAGWIGQSGETEGGS